MKKNIFLAVLLFIMAAISLALGIVMIPKVTQLGLTILIIVIGVLLLIYVYGYLITVVKKSRGVMLVLTLIEMVILTLVALSCILIRIINKTFITEGIQVLGLAFWIRGVVESFRAYYFRGQEGHKYPVYNVIINVFLITIGTWFFFSHLISNSQLVWALAVFFIAASIALVVIGILKLTTNKKTKTA